MSDQSTSEPVIYKPIPGHKGYSAGSDGSIWSCWCRGTLYRQQQMDDYRWRQLHPGLGNKNRARYKIRDDTGKYRCVFGAVLVLEAFVGPRPVGMECCHSNSDPSDDRLVNIRWDTPKANAEDTRRNGTVRGSKNQNAKLTEADVVEIRRLRVMGLPRRLVGSQFGVGPWVIGFIDRGLTWKHVP